jgi:hypothetical protein
MTPEEEARIRVLPSLIAEEKDPAKVAALADELGRLLSQLGKPWPVDEKPRSS